MSIWAQLIAIARRTVFRLLVVILIVLSPALFPALLLWSERTLRWADLRELYAWVWGRMVWGYL